MTHVAMVEQEEGGFRATPLGLPDASVSAPTRNAAVLAVTHALAERLAHAEVIEVDVPVLAEDPLEAAFGLFADDPELIRQICSEAYAARDAEEIPGP